jgi:hypothetical protein
MATARAVQSTAPSEYPMEIHAPRALAVNCPSPTAATDPNRKTNAAANTPSDVILS